MDRNEAEWDAEIEADFRRVVAATRLAGRKKRGRRLVGVPFAFLIEVCRLTRGRAALLLALLIYRRTRVCGNRTVTLPTAELAELGIGSRTKLKALAQLVTAALIRAEAAPGNTTKVTLLWKP